MPMYVRQVRRVDKTTLNNAYNATLKPRYSACIRDENRKRRRDQTACQVLLFGSFGKLELEPLVPSAVANESTLTFPFTFALSASSSSLFIVQIWLLVPLIVGPPHENRPTMV